MKLLLTQENFSKSLNNVAKTAISSRNPLAILNNVLLLASDNRLKLVATNLEIAITEFVGAKIDEEGSITVPAKLLQEFISSLPAGNIKLQVSDNKVLVTSGNYSATINGFLSDEFPDLPKVEAKTEVKIEAKIFKRGMQQVIFAASSDDSRPVLTAVYIHTRDGYLYAAATDSYRLAEKRLTKTKQEVSLLVPATTIQEVMRVMDDAVEDVLLTADDQQAQFNVGEIQIVSRLIDGKYPDYHKLLPQSSKVKATISRADLSNITKVSSLFARESAGSITLHIDETKKQIEINSVASQVGENSAKADAEVDGTGDITLNSRFLLDAISALNSDDVMVGFNDKLEPFMITTKGSDDYLHVIMPLKS